MLGVFWKGGEQYFPQYASLVYKGGSEEKAINWMFSNPGNPFRIH